MLGIVGHELFLNLTLRLSSLSLLKEELSSKMLSKDRFFTYFKTRFIEAVVDLTTLTSID